MVDEQQCVRFGREDERWRWRLGASKKLRKGLTLDGDVTYLDNDSDRLDPTVETDEVGYEEFLVMVGLRYKL